MTGSLSKDDGATPWAISRRVAGELKRRGTLHELFEVRPIPAASLFVGVVVSAPSEAEILLLRRIGQMIRQTGWDGRPANLLRSLRDLADAIARDTLVEIIRRDYSERKFLEGVSLGGIAECMGGDLAAFRVGRFRVMSSGREDLAEEIHARKPDFAGQQGQEWQRLLYEGPTRCFPFTDWQEADLVWRRPRPGEHPAPLSVFYSRPFRPGPAGEDVAIRIDAEWGGY